MVEQIELHRLEGVGEAARKKLRGGQRRSTYMRKRFISRVHIHWQKGKATQANQTRQTHIDGERKRRRKEIDTKIQQESSLLSFLCWERSKVTQNQGMFNLQHTVQQPRVTLQS